MKPRIWYVNGDFLWFGNGSDGGLRAALGDKRKGTSEEDNYAVQVVKYEDYLALKEEFETHKKEIEDAKRK